MSELGRGPRFRESMPKPVMALFLVSVAGAAALIVWLFTSPPRAEVLPLAERRPPPGGVYTHDVGRVVPAPVPTPLAPFRAPCPEFAGVRVEGGPPGIERFTAALRRLCGLAGGGVAPELAEALRGLDGATLRFAAFERSGVESTAEPGRRYLWLNVRFARAGSPFSFLPPVIAHEAFHLAHAGREVTAEEELGARTAELAACRQLIQADRWPRHCHDARRLIDLGREGALAILVSEGYRP